MTKIVDCDRIEKNDVNSDYDESKLTEFQEHRDESKEFPEHRDESKITKSHREHQDGSKLKKNGRGGGGKLSHPRV